MITAKKQYTFEPDYVVLQGETLKEVMESRDISPKELSVRAGITVQSLNRIFKEDKPVTYVIANKLKLFIHI